jgi:pimeloyl-ACP methyl ester carboxylesterase
LLVSDNAAPVEASAAYGVAVRTGVLTELTVDDGNIHAERTGPAGSDAVLLLHAGVADRRVWDDVVEPLAAAGYDVIRYDMRGFGRSAPASKEHSLVADALAVLDAAGVAAAHFVGLSQGAATSVDTALAHPGRVRSLTLVAPGLTGYEWPRLPGFAERMAAGEAGDTHGYALAIARLWAPLSFAGSRSSGECDSAAKIILDQAEQFMRDELEVEEPSALGRLGEIKAPTLVVLGDSDVEPITEIGGLLTTGIPGARSETLSGADHMLPLRVPAELTRLLLAHLRAA